MAVLLLACALPILILAAAFWLIGGPAPAVIVLLLGGAMIVALLGVLAWGFFHDRRIRRRTSIDLDESAGILRFRKFRERVDGRMTTRAAERQVPLRSIRAVRRTTHGPNWDLTVVWVDDGGRERQVLVDRDDLPGGSVSELLALRLGLNVETGND